ncbi:MAG: hypothetical protein JWQ96_348 [Segetibacter sp.]|nr:hypothetical protein [Segetibacter sp.]
MNKQNQEKVESIKTGDKQEIVEQVKGLQSNADTLAKNLSAIDPEKAEKVNKSGDSIQILLTQIKRTPPSNTAKIKMLSNRVIFTNNKIRKISNEALKVSPQSFGTRTQ